MSPFIFTGRDREFIAQKGLTEEAVERQLATFARKYVPLSLNRPCTIGDGIVHIADARHDGLILNYEEEVRKTVVLKFVPASGAASRMFRDWFALRSGNNSDAEITTGILEDIPRYGFFNDLKAAAARQGMNLGMLIEEKRIGDILDLVLGPEGLHYARIPKALIPFHAYGNESRTSLEEHLVEAALYVRDGRGISRLHFTVSEEHRSSIERFIHLVRTRYEKAFNTAFDISISVQHHSTDTIAVDSDGNPCRDDRGNLLFRPGGHGALLKNLNALEAPVIFIKNIDNVVPDRLRGPTVLYKKLLGGYLFELQREIFEHRRALAESAIDEARLAEAKRFCRERLSAAFPGHYDGGTTEEKRMFLIDRLDRPLRICGMVRNVGEPGGGPFWINEPDGTQSLQVIEKAQIDTGSREQTEIWESSTHFSPVDLVCGVTDHRGQHFDLDDYVDPDTYLVTEKSFKGATLRALELPGLWNGSMARWNTVFVEVPLITFNPVKTVTDLLRKEHQDR